MSCYAPSPRLISDILYPVPTSSPPRIHWKVSTAVYQVITFYDSSPFVSLNPFKILAKVFSRGALESYLPRLQDVVKSEIAKWCAAPGAIDVYAAAKSLTFRVAVRVLLGLQLEEERTVYLAGIFEQLMNNLFSLPIDAPLSGLRKVRTHVQTLRVAFCKEKTRQRARVLSADRVKVVLLLHGN